MIVKQFMVVQIPTALNYDSTATVNDPNNPCVYSILGCTDPLALNYDPLATVDDKVVYMI